MAANNADVANMGSDALGTLGMVAGVYYAFTKDMSFWGYVGFGFLGSIAGGAVGHVLDITVLNKMESK